MSWKKVKMGEFLKVRPDRFKPNAPEIQNLKRIEKIDFSGKIYVSDKPTNTDMILVKSGDFVISGINVEKGAMSVYQGVEDITATIHYSSYTLDEKKIDLEFLKFFLKSDEFKDALKEQVPGGIKTEIKPKHLLPLVVEIPEELEIQKQVVGRLNSQNQKFESLRSELTHQQTLLTRLRQSILQEAVQGKLTAKWRQANPHQAPASELLRRIQAEKAAIGKKEKPLPPVKAEEMPFELPEGWVWCRIDDIALVASGSTPKQDAFLKEGQIPYLKMYNLVKQAINFQYKPQYIKLETHNKLLKRSIAYPGDVLMNIVGPPLGKLAIIPDDFPEWNFNQAIVLMRPFLPEMNKWIFWYLNEMSEINSISTKGMAGQDNISVTQTRNMRIPLPPLPEQTAIVAQVERLLGLVGQLEAEAAWQRVQAEGLLQAALREAMG